MWYAYVPAGNVYCRLRYGNPNNDVNAFNTDFSLLSMDIGQVYAGAAFNPDSTGWTETAGGWAATNAGPYSNMRRSGTDGDIVDITIPDGYNRITMIIYRSSNGGTLDIGWNDASSTADLDITSYDSVKGDGNQLEEIVIATTAESDGVKKLRLTRNDAVDQFRIAGVRCWNTSLIADPSDSTGGLADGNSFIDLQTPTISGTNPIMYTVPVSGSYQRISDGDDRAYLFALSSKDTAGTLTATNKWVGDNSHFGGANDADFVVDASTEPSDNGDLATEGPLIRVDGVASDQVWDLTNNPMGALHTGSRITLQTQGFADYNASGGQTAGEPFVSYTTVLDDSGISVSINIDFNVATTINKLYLGMFAIQSGEEVGGYFYAGNDFVTKNDCNGGSDITVSNASGCELHLAGLDAHDVALSIDVIGPVESVFWADSALKVYSIVNEESMVGGATPTTGDKWVIGCKHSFVSNTLHESVSGLSYNSITGGGYKNTW